MYLITPAPNCLGGPLLNLLQHLWYTGYTKQDAVLLGGVTGAGWRGKTPISASTAKLEVGVESLQCLRTRERCSPLLSFQSWWQWLPGAPGGLWPVPNTAWHVWLPWVWAAIPAEYIRAYTRGKFSICEQPSAAWTCRGAAKWDGQEDLSWTGQHTCQDGWKYPSSCLVPG